MLLGSGYTLAAFLRSNSSPVGGSVVVNSVYFCQCNVKIKTTFYDNTVCIGIVL